MQYPISRSILRLQNLIDAPVRLFCNMTAVKIVSVPIFYMFLTLFLCKTASCFLGIKAFVCFLMADICCLQSMLIKVFHIFQDLLQQTMQSSKTHESPSIGLISIPALVSADRCGNSYCGRWSLIHTVRPRL